MSYGKNFSWVDLDSTDSYHSTEHCTEMSRKRNTAITQQFIYSESYRSNEKTLYGCNFCRPFRNPSSITKAHSTTVPPSLVTSAAVAAAVPPVAIRSSAMI